MAKSTLQGGLFREGAKPLKLMIPITTEVIKIASYDKNSNYFQIFIVDRTIYEVATRYASLNYQRHIIEKEQKIRERIKYKYEGSTKSYIKVFNEIEQKCSKKTSILVYNKIGFKTIDERKEEFEKQVFKEIVREEIEKEQNKILKTELYDSNLFKEYLNIKNIYDNLNKYRNDSLKNLRKIESKKRITNYPLINLIFLSIFTLGLIWLSYLPKEKIEKNKKHNDQIDADVKFNLDLIKSVDERENAIKQNYFLLSKEVNEINQKIIYQNKHVFIQIEEDLKLKIEIILSDYLKQKDHVTYRQITKDIHKKERHINYIYMFKDAHQPGMICIGQTVYEDVEKRIKQEYKNMPDKPYEILFSEVAEFKGNRKVFTDKHFHKYLNSKGYVNVPNTEWFYISINDAVTEFNKFTELE